MKDYAVLHFRFDGVPPEVPESRDSLSPYIRTEKIFTWGETAYPLRTAWSLPDFDTLSYSLQLSFDVLASVAIAGEVLAWNPGQGHISVFLLSRESNSIATTLLAARDCLEVAITERAVSAGGHLVGQVRSVPAISGLLDSFPRECADFFVAVPRTIPRVPWQPELREAARFLLKPGARLFVVSTSTEMHRFLQTLPGLRLVESRKSNGFRAAVLQRL
jgi:hypothetical protein